MRAVATAADVPGERWYGLLYNDWPGFVAVGEEVRYVGDVLAAVAANDEPHGARGRRAHRGRVRGARAGAAIPAASIAEGAPQVNPTHANVLSRSLIRRGDVDAALAASAHVVEGTWKTQRIEHLYPRARVRARRAAPRTASSRSTRQGQGVFDDRRQVAGFLGIPEEDLYVELVPNGGAFGGKEDMSVQSQTALLAKLTGKPGAHRADARRVGAAPPQAPPHHHGLHAWAATLKGGSRR